MLSMPNKLLLCRAGMHKPMPGELWNDGYYFSPCARCHQALIRMPNRPWKAVPRGFKIVWKQRTAADVDWTRWTRMHAVRALENEHNHWHRANVAPLACLT